ncbi:carbohydrate kinase family protein [Candidatus Bipolaricaulota bacterium]|nr:carbohydrate kinase family protein [Candidatus Bipolaricaulota bacterium]
MHIVVLGDLNLDILVDLPLAPEAKAQPSIAGLPICGGELRGRIQVAPGGAAATFSRIASAEGAEVTLIASIGDDLAGRILSRELERDGVRLLGRRSHRRTGVVISAGTAGAASGFDVHTMICDRGANDDLTAETADLLDTGRVDHLHVSGYAFLSPAQREAARAVLHVCSKHRPRIAISVDPPPAVLIEQYGRERFLRELDSVCMLFPNEEEALFLTTSTDAHASAEALASRFRTGAVTLGDRGAVVWDERGVFHLAAAPVIGVHTTGAGDVFAAAFVTAVHTGASASEAGRRAGECGRDWLERRRRFQNGGTP